MAATTERSWRDALGGGRLLGRGFGQWGGGIYDISDGEPEALDDLATSGIAVGGGRLWRVLRAPGEQTSTCELLAYDARGLRSYRRLDAIRDPHDVCWHEGAAHVSSSWDDAVWRVSGAAAEPLWRARPDHTVPDAWHVNSLLVVDGALHVCAFGRFERHKAWKAAARKDVGFVLDLRTGLEVLAGLTHPHAPVGGRTPGTSASRPRAGSPNSTPPAGCPGACSSAGSRGAWRWSTTGPWWAATPTVARTTTGPRSWWSISGRSRSPSGSRFPASRSTTSSPRPGRWPMGSRGASARTPPAQSSSSGPHTGRPSAGPHPPTRRYAWCRSGSPAPRRRWAADWARRMPAVVACVGRSRRRWRRARSTPSRSESSTGRRDRSRRCCPGRSRWPPGGSG